MENNMSIVFDAKSQNEGLARMVVAAFLTELDPTVEEMNDIKTARSEERRVGKECQNSSVRGSDEFYYTWIWRTAGTSLYEM